MDTQLKSELSDLKKFTTETRFRNARSFPIVHHSRDYDVDIADIEETVETARQTKRG